MLPGVPQIYYVGLLAGTNDMELLAATGVGRDVNRHRYTEAEVAAALDRPVVRDLLDAPLASHRSGVRQRLRIGRLTHRNAADALDEPSRRRRPDDRSPDGQGRSHTDGARRDRAPPRHATSPSHFPDERSDASAHAARSARTYNVTAGAVIQTITARWSSAGSMRSSSGPERDTTSRASRCRSASPTERSEAARRRHDRASRRAGQRTHRSGTGVRAGGRPRGSLRAASRRRHLRVPAHVQPCEADEAGLRHAPATGRELVGIVHWRVGAKPPLRHTDVLMTADPIELWPVRSARPLDR